MILVSLLSVINYHLVENFMVSKLYKFRSQTNSEPKPLKFRNCDSIRDYWRDTFECNFCLKCCCKLGRRQDAYIKARAKLFKEMNIIDIIIAMRYFRAATKVLADTNDEMQDKMARLKKTR
jgi:heterodisulfide reductase subunit A-like polyferredoxin